MTKEATVTRNLIKAMKNACPNKLLWVKKRHQTAYSAGEPDIAGVFDGHPFFIEVKRYEDGVLTALQAQEMKKLSGAKA